jgi:spermidine synthase
MERVFEPLTATSGIYFEAQKTLDRRTPHQHLQVFESADFGRVFKLDGCNMTSEKDEFLYHENLVHPAAITHPAPRRALIIGGGDGGTAEELLKHPTLDSVRLIELDADVLSVSKDQFAAVHRGAFADRRLTVTVADGLSHLRARTEQYDLILLDLTDPIGPAVALYDADTFALCRDALCPGGAVCLHIGSPIAHPQRVRSIVKALRSVFWCVAPYFCYVPLYGSLWGFAVASLSLDPRRLSAPAVAKRIADRHIGHLQHYNAQIHHAQFALPNYVCDLLRS